MRMRGIRGGQFARQAGHVAEPGMRLREGAEFVAIQQFVRGACALQQHDLDPATGHQLLELRQHRPVRGDAGAGADQQVAAVGVVRHQAETAERAAGVDGAADRHALEQGGGRTAGDVADRDLHRLARAEGVVVLGGQRIAAPRRGAIGIGEVDLDELAGDVVQRLAVVAQERQVGHGRRDHPPRDQLEGEMHDGQGMPCSMDATQRGGGGRTRPPILTAPISSLPRHPRRRSSR